MTSRKRYLEPCHECGQYKYPDADCDKCEVRQEIALRGDFSQPRLKIAAKELSALRDSTPCTCESGGWPCLSCKLFYLSEALLSNDGIAGPFSLNDCEDDK